MMRKIRTSALLFMMLALLTAPLSMGALIAGATESENETVFTTEGGVEFIGEVDEEGNPIDVEPIDVPELEGSGIMAISAELDPDDALAPQARIGGEVVPFESLIYKVMQSHDQWIVIVGGTLAENTPLPATIEVAVPTGSPVFWFGEVGGSGDPQQDPVFSDDRRDMRTEGDFDIYSAVMTTYHDMQIEYRLNHNPFTQGPDGPTIALEYVPWQDVAELRLAAALPPGSAVLAPDIEFLGFGPGETPDDRAPAFARVFTDVSAGEVFSTEITYTITGSGSAVSNLSDVVLFGLVAGLVVITGIVFFLFARGMSKRSTPDDEDDYEEDEDDESDEDEDE
ncbi:MAG: hypothetical protein FWE48_01165 [Coriobacteriia bacterium]|nr:hypothetical protein [Coriobacteriia bacterium]MCL2745689.1 hypothetical protein [Coriobacteriia bacterium]MCL2870461.1 hypothetical protein [Coriobacteriia bacterium]